MYLVDEQHLAGLKVRQDRGQVPGPLDRGAAGDADRNAELVGDDVGERGLAHAGRSMQRDMVERLAAALRGLDEDPQLTFDRVLVDVFVVGEALRPERRLERSLAVFANARRHIARLLPIAGPRAPVRHARALRTAAAIRSVAVARGTNSASLALRGFSSTWSSLSVRFDTVARNGIPMRSASANLTPAVSSRSSYNTSIPACSKSATSASAAARTVSSFEGSAMTCTWYGATAIGHRMPLSSWCVSTIDWTARPTPMP